MHGPRLGRVVSVTAALVAFLLAGASGARADEFILNGGFETGTVAGWDVIPATRGSYLDVRSFFAGRPLPHTGTYAVFFAAYLSEEDTISQTFETTPNTSYTVTFWLAHVLGMNNRFEAFWNGVPIMQLSNTAPFDYAEFTFAELATGPFSTLAFSAYDNPSVFLLDDVSVTVMTPEPASLLLLAAGLAFLARAQRRHRSVSPPMGNR